MTDEKKVVGWTHERDRPVNIGTTEHPDWTHYVTEADGAHAVARAHGRTAKEAAERARLIAAAPELYEALEQICEKWESDAWVTDQDAMHAIARAALAKANGTPSNAEPKDTGDMSRPS